MLLKELAALIEMPIPKKAVDRKEVVDAAKSGNVEDFIEMFSKNYSSAADIWMPEWQCEELRKLVADGAKVTTVMVDMDANENAALMATNRMKKLGWKIFAEEDNMSSWEGIFYKD